MTPFFERTVATLAANVKNTLQESANIAQHPYSKQGVLRDEMLVQRVNVYGNYLI